jgi:mRNA interferase HigB
MCVRIIAWKMLRDFAEAGHPMALGPLRDWHNKVEAATWNNFGDVKADYPSADLIGDRLVFNIHGNRYRLICAVNFKNLILFTKWVGTHAEYDRLDVRNAKMP